MNGPARQARILAQIEAEVGRDDPRLLALFDGFARAGGNHRQGPRRPLQRRLPGVLAAVLMIGLLLTASLARTAWRASAPGHALTDAASFAGRASAVTQRWITDGAAAIREEICRSVPTAAAGTCA
jgi:hypothetical protein